MATKIRLTRRGRKKQPIYDIVIADSRAPRDGRFIERVGRYNPFSATEKIQLDFEKAYNWLMTGAQPTETVKALLSQEGVLYKKHLAGGVRKGAFSQEEADKKFDAWLAKKANKDQEGVDAKAKAAADKITAFEAQRTKVREEIVQKAKEAELALIAEVEAAKKAEEAAAEASAETEAAPADEAAATEEEKTAE